MCKGITVCEGFGSLFSAGAGVVVSSRTLAGRSSNEVVRGNGFLIVSVGVVGLNRFAAIVTFSVFVGVDMRFALLTASAEYNRYAQHKKNA